VCVCVYGFFSLQLEIIRIKQGPERVEPRADAATKHHHRDRGRGRSGAAMVYYIIYYYYVYYIP